MSPEQKALAIHRAERAEVTINEAMDELARGNFRLTANRAYYAVFYMMRAFLATVEKDSSKHSGVISFFNQHFIKTGVVPEVTFKSIQFLMDLRHEGDYQDFAVITEEEANDSAETARRIIVALRDVLHRLIETGPAEYEGY